MTAHEGLAEDEQPAGQRVWVVTNPDGSEQLYMNDDELMAVVHRGEVWSVEYDADTGLYRYLLKRDTES